MKQKREKCAKKALEVAIISPIKFPQVFVRKRQVSKTVLEYGPPGCGKSYLANVVATES